MESAIEDFEDEISKLVDYAHELEGKIDYLEGFLHELTGGIKPENLSVADVLDIKQKLKQPITGEQRQ